MMADPLQATAEWPAVLAAAQCAQTSREVIARYTRVNVVMSTLKRTMYHCSRVWEKIREARIRVRWRRGRMGKREGGEGDGRALVML